MRQEVLNILVDILGNLDFSKETGLLTDEIFDSYDIILFQAAVSEKLCIEIEIEDITEENFNSYEAICRYLETQQEKL